MGRGERNGKAHNKRDEKRPDRRGNSSGEVETGRVCETWEEAIRQGGVRSLGSSTWTRGGGKRWVMGGELVKDGEWVKGDRWRQEEHEGRDACHCTTQHRQGRCLSHTIHHVTPDKTHHKPSFTIKHPEISPGKKSTSRAASFASPSFPHALQTCGRVATSHPFPHSPRRHNAPFGLHPQKSPTPLTPHPTPRFFLACSIHILRDHHNSTQP